MIRAVLAVVFAVASVVLVVLTARQYRAGEQRGRDVAATAVAAVVAILGLGVVLTAG